jgi:LacI family transcriptional regulator
LDKEKHFHVALFIETSHEFGREVLRGIRDYERTLKSHWGFYLNPDGIMQDLPRMGGWPCTGIIARVFAPEAAARLQKLGRPLVLLDPFSGRLRLSDPSVPVISTDTRSIVRMAFDHLRGCGCKRFAFIHSVTPTVWSESRGEAFAALAKAEGFPCAVYPSLRREPPWEEDIGNLGRWLATLPRPLGVFAAMDERGRHVIEACREAGLRVPEDVAVVGVDNDPLLCELCEPSLSSIALDAHGAGMEAARQLHRLMEGRGVKPGTQILVAPTHISRRASTAIGHDEDPYLAAAKNFLFKNVGNPAFQIPLLAKYCGVSRRALEKRILASTGLTLLQTLTALRMERACSLLRDTRDNVEDIATACGFSDAGYFRKAFRKRLGKTPQEYRAE